MIAPCAPSISVVCLLHVKLCNQHVELHLTIGSSLAASPYKANSNNRLSKLAHDMMELKVYKVSACTISLQSRAHTTMTTEPNKMLCSRNTVVLIAKTVRIHWARAYCSIYSSASDSKDSITSHCKWTGEHRISPLSIAWMIKLYRSSNFQQGWSISVNNTIWVFLSWRRQSGDGSTCCRRHFTMHLFSICVRLVMAGHHSVFHWTGTGSHRGALERHEATAD